MPIFCSEIHLVATIDQAKDILAYLKPRVDTFFSDDQFALQDKAPRQVCSASNIASTNVLIPRSLGNCRQMIRLVDESNYTLRKSGKQKKKVIVVVVGMWISGCKGQLLDGRSTCSGEGGGVVPACRGKREEVELDGWGTGCGLADWRVTVEAEGVVDMWIQVIVGGMRMVVGQERLRVGQLVIPIRVELSTARGKLSTYTGDLEGVVGIQHTLYGKDVPAELLVLLYLLVYLGVAVHDGGMVATPESCSYLGEGAIGFLPAEVHGHLASEGYVFGAA